MEKHIAQEAPPFVECHSCAIGLEIQEPYPKDAATISCGLTGFTAIDGSFPQSRYDCGATSVWKSPGCRLPRMSTAVGAGAARHKKRVVPQKNSPQACVRCISVFHFLGTS